MFVNAGNEEIPKKDIIGIFDTDTATVSKKTRDMLAAAEKRGQIRLLTDDLPRSFIITEKNGEQTVYLSQYSAATLLGRSQETF